MECNAESSPERPVQGSSGGWTGGGEVLKSQEMRGGGRGLGERGGTGCTVITTLSVSFRLIQGKSSLANAWMVFLYYAFFPPSKTCIIFKMTSDVIHFTAILNLRNPLGHHRFTRKKKKGGEGEKKLVSINREKKNVFFCSFSFFLFREVQRPSKGKYR